MIGFFDSCWYSKGTFRAIVGVGVLFRSLEESVRVYERIASPIRQLIRRVSGREFFVVKSDHMTKLLPESDVERLFYHVLEEAKRIGESLLVVITKFARGEAMQRVLALARDLGLGASQMSVLETIYHLHPLVVAHRALKHVRLGEVYLDDIHGPVSTYWFEVLKATKLRVVPRGDWQYEGLALADIIGTSLVGVVRRLGRLSIETVRELLPSARIEWVPAEDIVEAIASAQLVRPGVRMNVASLRPRPQYLVVAQPDIPRSVVEWSRVMSEVYRRAREDGGFAKLFARDEDAPYISERDVIIVIGRPEWAGEQAALFRRMYGCRVEIVELY